MSKSKTKVCPICRKADVTGWSGIRGFNYCSSCNTSWRKKFLKTKYESEYFEGKSSLASKLFEPIAYVLYKLRSIYVGFYQKELWIDVGAAEGGFLKTINARKKIGVEVSRYGRKQMEKAGIEPMTDRVFLSKRKLDADVISFWHVLEHVEKPWQYLQTAKKNLSRKGKIVVGVPNVDSLEFQVFGKHWFHLQRKFHLWHFSINSIKYLLEKEGFKVDKVDSLSIEHHLSGVLQSFINKSSGSQDVLQGLVKRSTNLSSFSLKDAFWSVFWMSFGLPLVLGFWVYAIFIGRPGTVVITARRVSKAR